MSMRAVITDGFGEPAVLKVSDIAKPVPQAHEVLIKVKATGINRADTLQRKGKYAPPPGTTEILGLEAAGVIEQVGDDVQTFKAGDRVFALLSGGGYAEYCVVPSSHVLRIPETLSFNEAASIAENWLTAYQLLHFVGSVKAGHNVLIHAGASGVGLAAIQLAVSVGAMPYVTVGSAEKLDSAVAMGAKGGANRHEGPWAEKLMAATDGHGFDLILDCVGASYWSQNADVAAVDGEWVLYGLMGGVDVDGPLLRTILRKRLSLKGTTLRARSDAYKTSLVEAFAENALPKFSSGDFKTVVDAVFSFEKAADAHAHMEANKNTGKIVLVVCDDNSEQSGTKDEL